MRKALVVLTVAVSVALQAAPPREQSFRGEISDSQCATNVHSVTRTHKEMLKSGWMGTSEADCVRYCVKNMGGEFVLVDGNKVYHLDNQAAADTYAARKVLVRGTLQRNTIHVSAIEAAN